MQRFHQNRRNQAVRDACAETRLGAADLIPALFVVEDENYLQAVPGLETTWHAGIKRLAEALSPWFALGMDKVLLFGICPEEHKTPDGRAAWSADSLIARAVREIRTRFPAISVITDVCLCAYTSHGHCGVLTAEDHQESCQIDNDATLPLLAAMAVCHARAGAQWVAPSAMMDGQVQAIRQALDAAGFQATRILGYSAKFASALYGPFRGAAGSAPGLGDRASYQMDIRNGREALSEIAADLAEGAAAVMVKPAVHYLDVIARARDKWPEATIAAYHTSGEFMALRAAAQAGVLDGRKALHEQLTAIKRAGADWIITYGGAAWLKQAEEARW